MAISSPFDHNDFIFELKHDGFRALAYITPGHPNQAQETLKKALEFNPSFQQATDLLNQIVK